MDKRVITKIIEHYGEPCPNFKYKNPLLDKNVADLLAKGFIKLLNNQDSSNDQHRLLVLENIRKSCKVEPTNHLYIDDNVTEALRSIYEKLPDNCNINKDLDSFLIRNLKEINIISYHSPSFNTDIIQALVNLNKDKQEINDILMKDIIYWNVDSKENNYLDILNTIWNVEYVNGLSKVQSDDVSIKIRPLIEKILLSSALEMLNTVILDEDDWFAENDDLNRVTAVCSVSSECFQISCSIMNTIFIKTNFDMQMSNFITLFIDSVKLKVVQSKNISQLYSANLQHIVLLLDIELNNLNGNVKTAYISHTIKHLNSLHEECESDLIMLLSHFNHWLIYYDRILQ